MFEGIKLTKDSIIYILSPRGIRTGGPTLLHQLASAIIKKCYTTKKNFTTEIYYYDGEFKNAPDSAYSEYHIKKSDGIEDKAKNVVIVPEPLTTALDQFSNIQKVIWWMSVDNYCKNFLADYTKYYQNQNFTLPMPKHFNFTSKEPIFHFAQSRYALDFLQINKVPKKQIFWLSDYLHPVFLKRANQVDISKKEKIVAYNPKKGNDFTRKIIEMVLANIENSIKSKKNSISPDMFIKFEPIENMTPEEVENLLARAMVYIDFGHHPGKDRIPREAAISGCVVITGKQGAARNDEDIPIDAEFKFDNDDAEIPNIIKKITEVFEDFPKYHAKFERYRENIRQEPQKFEEDVVKVFNLPNNRTKKFAAILQTGAREKVCRDFIANNKDLELVFIVGEDKENDIEHISMNDAIFLYQEKRIEKFIAVTITDAEKEKFIEELKSLGIDEEDLIFIDVRR